MRQRRPRRPWNRDDGAASVLALAIIAVVLVLGAFVGVLGAATAARHQAQSAADLAALAAARVSLAGGAACAAAAELSATNGAEVTGCVLSGEDVVVTVRVPVAGMWAHATARAGPG